MYEPGLQWLRFPCSVTVTHRSSLSHCCASPCSFQSGSTRPRPLAALSCSPKSDSDVSHNHKKSVVLGASASVYAAVFGEPAEPTQPVMPVPVDALSPVNTDRRTSMRAVGFSADTMSPLPQPGTPQPEGRGKRSSSKVRMIMMFIVVPAHCACVLL